MMVMRPQQYNWGKSKIPLIPFLNSDLAEVDTIEVMKKCKRKTKYKIVFL